jgi:hypothetical protein
MSLGWCTACDRSGQAWCKPRYVSLLLVVGRHVLTEFLSLGLQEQYEMIYQYLAAVVSDNQPW